MQSPVYPCRATRYQRLTETISRRSGNHFRDKLWSLTALLRICCLFSTKFTPSLISPFHTFLFFLFIIYVPSVTFSFNIFTCRSRQINTSYYVSKREPICITRNMICDIKDINWLKCFLMQKKISFHILPGSLLVGIQCLWWDLRPWISTKMNVNTDNNLENPFCGAAVTLAFLLDPAVSPHRGQNLMYTHYPVCNLFKNNWWCNPVM